MYDVVKGAFYDRIIEDEDMTINSYLDWIVFNNDQEAVNSLYAAVADGLNKQLAITNNETTNPYTIELNGKKTFTFKTLQQLVIDVNKTKNPQYDLNDVNNVIVILETTLKIKFILFEMFLRDDQSINIGDLVLYKRNSEFKPHRVISKKTNDTGKIIYDLYDGFNDFTNIEEQNIKKYSNNPLKEFRVFCDSNSDIQLDDYMYIVIRKKKNKGSDNTFLKYQLVQEIGNNYVFTKEKIPIYIKYLIFNSCPNLRNLNYLLEINEKFKKTIDDTKIKDYIDNIKEKIIKYEDDYNLLKNKENKSDEEKIKELLFKKEINKLRDELENIRSKKIIYPTDIEEKEETKENENNEEKEKKDEKEEKDKKKQKVNWEFTRYDPNYNEDEEKEEKEEKEETITGGQVAIKPSEQYSQYNSAITPTIPKSVFYYPRQGYYPYPYQNYYANRYNIPYYVSQNKAKEQKSKLSFYITIELELFPGESANLFQKSVVKCQSTFERIREAWTDIFGLEYRPAPMNEAYAYSIKKDNKENKTQKTKTTRKNNKTLKTYSNL